MSCGSADGGPTATVTGYSTNSSAGTTFVAANVAKWPGVGVGSPSEGGSGAQDPNHTLDNSNGLDLIELNFGATKVALTSVTISYKPNDADISVLRYTGAAAPADITGKAITGAGGLLSSGWELVGNYADLVVNTAKAINGSALTSSYWLISAYSTQYGGNTGSNLDGGNDYIKVLTIAGTPSTTTKVPEPASLALVAAALFAMFGVSRRGRRDDTPATIGMPAAA